MWNFNNFLYCAVDRYDSLFEPINDLQLSVDLVSDIGLEDEVVLFDDLVSVDGHFLNVSAVLFNCDDLFFDQGDLDEFLLDDWDFNDFFPDGFNDLVDLDNDWVVHGHLYDLRNGDDSFDNLLHLVNLWNLICNCDDLLDDVGNFDNLLHCGVDRDNFLPHDLNFLDDLVHVRNDLFDLLDHLSHNWSLNILDHLLNSNFLDSDLNHLLDLLGDLHDLFDFPLNSHELLDDSVNWDWHLNGNSERSVHLHNLFDFHNLGHDSVNMKLSWNFNLDFDDLFAFFLDDLDSFDHSLNWDHFLDNLFDNSVDFVVDVLDDFDFLDALLNDGDLNQSFDFSDSFDFNNSVNDFLYDLWDFHNLFDDSGDDNDSFNDFLYFDDLWHLNHLFDDLVNVDSDFLDSLDCSGDFDNLLDDDLDWVVLHDVMIDWLFDFNDLVDFDNPVHKLLNFNDLQNLNLLDNNLGDQFWHSHDSLVDDWNLHSSVHYFLDFLNQGCCVVYDPINLLYPVLVDDLLSDHFHNLHCWNLDLHLHNLLNRLWNFHDLFNHLDDWNWLLNLNLNNLRNRLHMVDHFSRISVLH